MKLKRTYVPRLEKVILGMKAARYLQIESRSARSASTSSRRKFRSSSSVSGARRDKVW